MKGLYLAYQIPATLFFWLPSWIIISTPPALRPRRSWTLSQCVGVRLVSHLFKITCAYVLPFHFQFSYPTRSYPSTSLLSQCRWHRRRSLPSRTCSGQAHQSCLARSCPASHQPSKRYRSLCSCGIGRGRPDPGVLDRQVRARHPARCTSRTWGEGRTCAPWRGLHFWLGAP
jgi:hypothetical protein